VTGAGSGKIADERVQALESLWVSHRDRPKRLSSKES